MKQLLLSCCLLSLLMLTVGLAYGQTADQQTPKGQNTQEGIGTFVPDFKFYDMNDKPFTRLNLPYAHPTIFFYFDPDCDHCQLIATWINAQKDLFKGITLVLVSWAEVDAIKEFPGKYLPAFTSDLFVVKDKEYKIDQWFGYSVTPSIYVYNNKGLRTASFKDETRPEILVKFAHQQ